MAERLGLFSTVGAEWGVVSIKPGGVGSQVAFLRAHWVDAACDKLAQAHERVWWEEQREGVVVWERERAPMLYDEGLCPPFYAAVGVGHDFVARQCREVRKESRVDQRDKRKALEKGKSKMRQCVQWEIGAQWGKGNGVFQLRGMTLGGRRVHRAQWELDALVLSSAGKALQRRAEKGLIDVGDEMSLRAAIRLLCGRSTVSGGRHDSATRIGTGVDRKQLVTHLCTCRQSTSILLRSPLVGVNRLAPYERIGNIKQ